MGLFKKKKQAKPVVKKDDAKQVAADIFNEEYRAQLQKIGEKHFKELITKSTSDLKTEVNAILAQMSVYLKEHLARQLDLTIARVNADMTRQLNERMSEFNRVASESQELVIQSLSRNAQIVHEKYQQMSSNLQQIIASQEVMMATVFQDNKTRVAAVESEQEQALGQLRTALQEMQQQTGDLASELRAGVVEKSAQLETIYQDNITQLTQVKTAQIESTQTLQQTTRSLEEQYQQLKELLDSSLAQQKAMVSELVNDNTARIVEHYLVGALGEKSTIRDQLPSILESLEENKQAMMDDINL